MLLKLSVSGIKSRFKDYLVLFSGLIVASGVFYMFESMALNKSFINANTSLKIAGMVFQLGNVLLAIITFFYILYANSFLMSMRQHDYGLFLILGAKKSSVTKLIFMETLVIGLLSLVIGIFLGGLGFSALSKLLMEQLDLHVTHVTAVYLPAVAVTAIFFVVLYLFAAIINSTKLIRIPVLELLHENVQPNKVRISKIWTAIQVVLGIGLLAVGYWCLANIEKTQLVGIGVAIGTIILGTYFLFNAVIIWIIRLLQQNKRFAYKGLNNFLLSQLGFRIKSYTKILTMVSILFAMALGAITVGISFEGQSFKMAKQASFYDIELFDENKAEKQIIDKMDVAASNEQEVKITKDTVYLNATLNDKHPWQVVDYAKNSAKDSKMHTKDLTTTNVNNNTDSFTIMQALPEADMQKKFAAVPEEKFANIKAPTKTIKLIVLNNPQGQLKQLKELNTLANKQYKYGEPNFVNIYKVYNMIHSLTSGLEFMGFFLGIAFLAMLASCLMFKILSGAHEDVSRFKMLNSIGARQKLMKNALTKEIFILFTLPALVGIVHVMFGMKMFASFFPNPYQYVGLSIGIFLVLYFLYFFLTRFIYQKIVLGPISFKAK